MEEHFHIFEKHHHDKDIVHYDVCILGGGPAGLTAALYASRYGLHTALISKEMGGMANLAHQIENYPSFNGTGLELMTKFYEHAKHAGAEFLLSEIANLHKDSTGYIIELTNSKVVHSKTIIIALGTEKRRLDIKGEDEFLGKGVSYCATCDANFFKNKTVAVIGGGDSACKAALILENIAKKIYLIYRKDELKCESSLQKFSEKIEVIRNAIPLEIKGDKKVSKLIIEKNGKEQIDLDGVFIEIGSIPVTSVIKKLKIKTDKGGYIHADPDMKTSVKGIFAAGDTIKSNLKQVIVAASQGAIAAKSAFDYLKK